MIETDTFRVNVPDNWKVEKVDKQFSIAAPNDGLLVLSSTSVSGGDAIAERDAVVDQIEQNALSAIKRTAKNKQLGEPMGPLTQTMNNGTVYHMMASFTRDKSYFIAQYVIRGQRTVIIATFEGPARAGTEIETVSQFLKTLRGYSTPPKISWAPPNKSLDASGGNVFRKIIGPAMLA